MVKAVAVVDYHSVLPMFATSDKKHQIVEKIIFNTRSSYPSIDKGNPADVFLPGKSSS